MATLPSAAAAKAKYPGVELYYNGKQWQPQYTSNQKPVSQATYNKIYPAKSSSAPTASQPVQQQSAPQQQSGGDYSGPSPEELAQQQVDAAYAPAYANLDAVEAQYRSEYPNSQTAIENSYAEVLPKYEQSKATQLQGIESQRATGKRTEKNEFGKARNLYNELKQSYLTRFGGSSSVGEAGQELLGRETSRQMGDITSKYGQYYQDLEKETANVNKFFADTMANLEKDKQLKLQELKTTFDTAIRQINTQKGALDANKSAARLAVLQEISAQARQVQYQAQQYAQQIEQWKAMRDQSLQLAQQYKAKSVTIPGIPNVIGNMTLSGMGGGSASTAETLPQGYYKVGSSIYTNVNGVPEKVSGSDDESNGGNWWEQDLRNYNVK